MFRFFKVDDELFYKEIFSDKLDIAKLEKIIKKGIDINRQDENGNSLLFLLVSQKKYEAIKLLLNNGADRYLENKFKKTPLDEACEKSDSSMVRFLLDNGYDINVKNSIGRTILQSTAILSNEKIFQVLMTYNPDFNIKDNDGKTVLFHAVEGKNLNILSEVAQNVSDINSLDNDYQTALFYAVLKDDTNIAQVLITHGINVNFLNKNGENVLFNAIIQGELNIPTIEALIRKNININIIDVYVYEDDILIQSHNLGNYRTVSQNAISSKFTNFKLELKANKKYTIISKLQSKSPIDASWFISYDNIFLSFIMYDILFWGLFFGFILSLIVYNISIYSSLKNTKPRNIKASLKSEAKIWCRHTDSNCGPTDYKSVALPTELCRRFLVFRTFRIGTVCSLAKLEIRASVFFKKNAKNS